MTISCWCEDPIPPWACVWIKSVLNHVALEQPIMVVTRPGIAGSGNNAFNERDLDVYTPDAAFEFYSPEPVYKQNLYTTNLRPNILTNGIIAVPAKTVFYCQQVLAGIHWMRYDETPDANGFPKAIPTDTWFFPRDDTWFLGSTNTKEAYGQSRDQLAHRIHGILFRRIGRADTIQKCVPVIMTISNFQVDDVFSVA